MSILINRNSLCIRLSALAGEGLKTLSGTCWESCDIFCVFTNVNFLNNELAIACDSKCISTGYENLDVSAATLAEVYLIGKRFEAVFGSPFILNSRYLKFFINNYFSCDMSIAVFIIYEKLSGIAPSSVGMRACKVELHGLIKADNLNSKLLVKRNCELECTGSKSNDVSALIAEMSNTLGKVGGVDLYVPIMAMNVSDLELIACVKLHLNRSISVFVINENIGAFAPIIHRACKVPGNTELFNNLGLNLSAKRALTCIFALAYVVGCLSLCPFAPSVSIRISLALCFAANVTGLGSYAGSIKPGMSDSIDNLLFN